VGERRRDAVSSIGKPRRVVEVRALCEDSFRITAPGQERFVVGYPEAQRTADALAERFK
jgi:hypothetical protein